jgi:polyisoprenoid-binding protein YceI
MIKNRKMKKIKIALVLFISLLFSFAIHAQETKTETSVDFKIKNFGINVDGFFGDVRITSDFSSNNPSEWRLEGILKVNSIDTDNKKRDKHLLEEDYFDTNTYPEIKLQATDFKKVSENKYDVVVSLTIKATTKTMTIPMEINNSNPEVTLQTNFEINRRDYKVGGSSFSMSNTAKIIVNYTLIKQ